MPLEDLEGLMAEELAQRKALQKRLEQLGIDVAPSDDTADPNDADSERKVRFDPTPLDLEGEVESMIVKAKMTKSDLDRAQASLLLAPYCPPFAHP
jgi:hypothetical protein